jgi:hypothetical protein
MIGGYEIGMMEGWNKGMLGIRPGKDSLFIEI